MSKIPRVQNDLEIFVLTAQATQNFLGAIGRGVIDYNDFVMIWKFLKRCADAGDEFLNVVRFVEASGDDAD